MGGARAKLTHEAIREVFVTDSVALNDPSWPHLHVVSVAPLIAGAIRRLLSDQSLGETCIEGKRATGDANR